MLAWLAEFIGRILKHLLKGWIEESKKPEDVTVVGGDDETTTALDNDIANSL